jgi:hypothetical protein
MPGRPHFGSEAAEETAPEQASPWLAPARWEFQRFEPPSWVLAGSRGAPLLEDAGAAGAESPLNARSFMKHIELRDMRQPLPCLRAHQQLSSALPQGSGDALGRQLLET